MEGDCIEMMKKIPDKSVDMVLTDPPYGSTECGWDIIVPAYSMWIQLKRIVKQDAAIVLFGNEVFTAMTILSNLEMYRYSLVWERSRVSRHAQAKHRFLSIHEDIMVFSHGRCSSNSKIVMKYYPQGLKDCEKVSSQGGKSLRAGRSDYGKKYVQTKTGYPKSVLKFPSEGNSVHPTQKPIKLLEHLVASYSLEGETVLDFTMGSGSTGVACKNLNRNFIGIEKSDKYFKIAKQRINGGKSGE